MLGVVAVGLSMALPGHAAERRDTVTLSEISITALKTEERLRGESVAVTLIGGPELERLDAVSIKGISDVVPNFYIPDYGSRITSSIYVRGIGARMDQPAVGLVVDNVPYLNKDAYDFDVADIVSVEMLRGPQSTLFGRNTMGGLISVSTLSPFRYQGWRIMAEGSTSPSARASLGWYHMFNTKTAVSLTGNASWNAGTFRNEETHAKTDKEVSGGLRGKVEWRPRRDLRLTNVLSLSWLRQSGYPYEYCETGRIAYNDTCFYHRFTLADGLTVTKNHDHFNVTSVTSLQYIDDNMTLDQDFLPESYFTLTQKKRETGLTEDLVFRSPRSGGSYQWTAGLFGFWKHLSMNAPVTFKDDGIAKLIESHRNDANPYYPIAWDTREFPLNSEFGITTLGAALYHESRLTLGGWHLSAGLRLDYERSAMDYHSFCSTSYTIYENPTGQITAGDVADLKPYRHVPLDIDDRGRLSREYWMLLPRVGVVRDLGEGESNVYANVSRGYKTGGFNTQMFSDVLQQRVMNIMGIGGRYDVDDVVGYRPESSWNYEIGAHTQWGGGAVRLDAALFYIACRDQQLTMFPDGTTTGRIMTNAGKTRSWGGELSGAWDISDALTLNASYGYTNARFVEFNDGHADYKGKRVPYAPSNTIFLQGLWTVTFPGRQVESVVTDINLRATGDIWWNESNTLRQNLYALLGATVTLTTRSGVSIQLWGKNLTGTRYNTFYFMSMGNEFVQRGKPASGGVTVRYSF